MHICLNDDKFIWFPEIFIMFNAHIGLDLRYAITYFNDVVFVYYRTVLYYIDSITRIENIYDNTVSKYNHYFPLLTYRCSDAHRCLFDFVEINLDNIHFLIRMIMSVWRVTSAIVVHAATACIAPYRLSTAGCCSFPVAASIFGTLCQMMCSPACLFLPATAKDILVSTVIIV